MTCKDFEHQWNVLLDAEDPGEAAAGSAKGTPGSAPSIDEVEASLLAHAADCPACRPIAAQYQTLRHAIRAWRRPPAPPADLVHRILSVPAQPTYGTARSAALRTRRFWHAHRDRIKLVSGLAASLLVAMILGTAINGIVRRSNTEAGGPAPRDIAREFHSVSGPELPPGGAPALDRALAEATSATWDLARSASEPAARISREVLDATVRTPHGALEKPVRPSAEPDEDLASLSVSVPSLDALGSDAPEASSVLQQVGDHLSAGVRPLSSTARHAFGFLLGPPPTRAGVRTGGSTSSGA